MGNLQNATLGYGTHQVLLESTTGGLSDILNEVNISTIGRLPDTPSISELLPRWSHSASVISVTNCSGYGKITTNTLDGDVLRCSLKLPCVELPIAEIACPVLRNTA
jgi:hypothetical protein